MSRLEDSGNEAELAKPAVWLAVLAELDFASGWLYANDGLHHVTYNGHDYLPTGEIAAVGQVREEVETVARPVTCVIGGSADLIARARDEVYQGRDCTFRLAVISEATGQPVATPEIIWEGRMDVMTIQAAEGVGTIELTCEHRLRREPRVARYTNVDQQMQCPGDTFFEHVPSIPGYVAHWGSAPILFGGGGPIGGGGTPYTQNEN